MTHIFNSKKFRFVVLSTALIAGAAYYMFAIKPDKTNPPIPSTKALSTLTPNTKKQPTDKTVSSAPTPTNKKEALPISADVPAEKNHQTEDETAEYFEFREKARSVGIYVSDGAGEQYKQYDTDTLNTLGDQGDLIALHTLADRYILEIQLEKGFEIYHKAAMYGSVKATQMIGSHLISSRNSAKDPANQILEGLAWFEVTKMRAGPYIMERSQRRFLEKNAIDLNTIDWDLVKERAEAIYQDLQAKRQEHGLDDFENVTFD